MSGWEILLIAIMTIWGNVCILGNLLGGYMNNPIEIICMLVAVVVGFVLKAIGIIPIGFMAVAIFSLVVGIFKNWVNQNEKNNSSVVDSETYEVERFNPKIETRETIEQGFNEPSNPIHTEPKKPLSKTNISLHFGFIVGWVVIISLVVYSLVKQNNDNSSDY